MSQSTLFGYAVPFIPSVTDHTYVTSSDGHSWSCHGRSEEGKLICSGVGSIDMAQCLAGPDGNAGIIYALTGVCHQIANRILFPSGMTVKEAHGYALSTFVWGAFGASPSVPLDRYHPDGNPWPELQTCQQIHSDS